MFGITHAWHKKGNNYDYKHGHEHTGNYAYSRWGCPFHICIKILYCSPGKCWALSQR